MRLWVARMTGELSTDGGMIILEDGEYFSASAIAALNLKGMPKSRAGVYKRAKKEGWPFVLQRGRGAKDGVKYFLLPSKSLAAYVSSPVTGLSTGSGTAYGLVANDHPGDGALGIQDYVNPKDSAGVAQETTVVRMRVDSGTLRERTGRHVGQIKIAAVSDDSMEPTLSHGDQVLIDTSCKRVVENAVYAIQQGGRLRFKRIRLKLDGSIIVNSDNHVDDDSETYTAEQAARFKVVGVVIPFKFGRFKL